MGGREGTSPIGAPVPTITFPLLCRGNKVDFQWAQLSSAAVGRTQAKVEQSIIQAHRTHNHRIRSVNSYLHPPWGNNSALNAGVSAPFGGARAASTSMRTIRIIRTLYGARPVVAAPVMVIGAGAEVGVGVVMRGEIGITDTGRVVVATPMSITKARQGAGGAGEDEGAVLVLSGSGENGWTVKRWLADGLSSTWSFSATQSNPTD
ncbi:hypothetical protein BD410DRAFT_449856 [Rickenella mellea]|uniref:Uncharacterized protein n=1 Tax=Rickenella mellea TaxID=50990 RepID=A0A4Y7PUJ4_9AGAM|nr:hypothetical protein BD410DRAFT_449856 [Rickenella mellea]